MFPDILGRVAWEIPDSNVALEADNLSVAATTEEAFQDVDYEEYYLSVNNEILPQISRFYGQNLKLAQLLCWS